MLSWSLLTFLASAPPTGFTVSVERLPVTRTGGELSVKVDPLMAQLALTGGTVSAHASQLCPKLERRGEVTTLHCTTRRLWAALVKDEKGTHLDVRQLLGVSWLDAELIPVKGYSPSTFLLPDTCPGTLAAARGECAFARGELEVAKAAFTEGLTTPDMGVCHLRLGDLAVRAGDVEAALAHWAKVPPTAAQGKLARQRTCEIIGSCLGAGESLRARDSLGMAPELMREVELASVRRELAAGRDAHAMTLLLGALERDATTCDGVLTLCQKLVAIGLGSADAEARMGALSVFLNDRVRRGPAEYELNRAASEAAQDLGAPGFAASILSANSPRVPRAELAEHLRQVIELYLAARDPVRAAVVLEYAEGKLGGATRSAAWSRVRRQLDRGPAPAAPVRTLADFTAALEALSDDVALSTDLARATAVRSRAAHPLSQAATPENAP